MSYNVIQLINSAYYASSIVSREFETVSGSQVNDGLQFLNEIIADTSISKGMIPYFKKYTFNVVAGQESYYIPNLELPDTLTFFLNSVRYQMRYMDREVYRGSSRANNINSLPFNWNFERQPGGGIVSLYFFPDTNYSLELWGLFRLTSVAINQDLLSPMTTINLGNVYVTGTGNIATGELVINGIDLAGTYANAAALVTHINTGVITNVTATLGLNLLTLYATRGTNIHLVTAGTSSSASNISFANFSTTGGPLDQTYLNLQLDQFYINYLKFALADRLCTEFNFIVPPGVAKQLALYEKAIAKRSAQIDLSQSKISTFYNGNTVSYGQANLGLGWTVQ